MYTIHDLLADERDEFTIVEKFAIMSDCDVPDDDHIPFDHATITRDAPATLTLADGSTYTITTMYASTIDEMNIVGHPAAHTPTRFVAGMIDNNEYAGLYVLPLAHCLLNSSWDFPSFVMSLGLDEHFDDEPTMYPTRDDAAIIADHIDLPADERDAFINDFPLTWDT